MKFHHLPIGQRFELDGKAYTKTSPVLATPHDGGGSQFMARFVVIKPLDGTQPPAKADKQRTLSMATVEAAFEEFDAACRKQLEPLLEGLPGEQHAAFALALDHARERFRSAISTATDRAG